MRLPIMLKYSIFLICLLPLSVLSEINKCFINGALVYTNKLCPEDSLQNFELVESSEDKSSKINERAYKSSKWYNDHTGYKKALDISASKKVPLFIYGRTDWCPYCKKFEDTFLSNSEVKKLLSRFVKVKLNPEHSSQDEKLFKRWGGKGYPSLFVQSGQELMPGNIKLPFVKRDGKWKMISNQEFISILQDQINNYQ